MTAADGEAPVGLVTSPAVVMAPRADGVDVVWSVSRLSRGWVEWDAGALRGVARSDPFGMVPQGEEVLRARVAGLPPGTEVRVRAITEAVGGERERHVGAWKSARTLDAAASAARIVVWNDTHERDETLRRLHEATPAADMLVWNGDLCNDWTRPDALASTVLHPAGLDVSDRRPLAVVVGNHDVRGTWAYRLREVVATPDGTPYWAARVGPVAFVVLHTGEDKPDDHPSFEGRVAFESLRAEQAVWLADAIRRPGIADAPYRVVFCHIPLRWIDETAPDYDGDGYDWFSRMSRDAWHESLVTWGAQLVVSGHTHLPAFLPATDDGPYAQLVAGGPDPDPAADEAATWIELAADESALTVTMRTLDGAVVHEGAWPPNA
jgi:3',5'-cyclic AMP phosphodiesterase CpdA